MSTKIKERFKFSPVIEMSICDWADRYRKLPAATSAIAGSWLTSQVEVFRGPAMAFDEDGVRILTIASAVQMGKSELLLSIIGRSAHLDQAPILLVQPNEASAAKFTRERLSPMIAHCPELRSRIDGRARMGSDSLFFRQFPGGYVAIEGAGSPSSLASRAIRYVLLDELDKYEVTREGMPSALAEARSATFGDRAKIVRVCSPTITGASPIWQSFLDGDQRRAAIACPHCTAEFFPKFFANVEWNKAEDGTHFPMTAALYCPHCGTAISEDQRRAIVTRKLGIRWYQTKPFSHCDLDQSPLETKKWTWDSVNQVGRACCVKCGEQAVTNRHASFQVSQLLSPFTTVAQLAADWIQASQDPDDKLTYRNTKLGEPADTALLAEDIDIAELMMRREHFGDRLPAGVVALFAGIDVQTGSDISDGSLHCYIYGVGVDRQMWSVRTEIMTGDIRMPMVWDQLDKLLLSRFLHESGAVLTVKAAAVDAGDGKVSEVIIDWCKTRRNRYIFATKGMSERSSASWSTMWPPVKAERSRTTGYRVKMVGTNAAKMSVYTRLGQSEIGPGYIHFGQDWDAARFAQLTAEKYSRVRRGNFETRRFVLPRGRANEALDGTALAIIATHGWLAQTKLSLEKIKQVIDSVTEEKPT